MNQEPTPEVTLTISYEISDDSLFIGPKTEPPGYARRTATKELYNLPGHTLEFDTRTLEPLGFLLKGFSNCCPINEASGLDEINDTWTVGDSYVEIDHTARNGPLLVHWALRPEVKDRHQDNGHDWRSYVPVRVELEDAQSHLDLVQRRVAEERTQ